jgi:EAL domain-containing protein (putative c-di-GMP-specific phosphodiesterase class I)
VERTRPDDAWTSSRRALTFLSVVTALNSLVCILAPGAIVVRSGGADARVGELIYAAAVTAVALTPIQLAAIAVVVAPRLREHRRVRRLQARIDEAVRTGALRVALQPLVDLATGTVTGVEALARFEDGRSPDRWFADADRVDRGTALELLAVRVALRAAQVLPAELDVAVNVSPALLTSPSLQDALEDSGIAPHRVVVEVTEHASVSAYPDLQAARSALRASGVRVAVDDAGAGYSSFRHILDLAPDIIKLDRSLVTGLDEDLSRRALVSAVVRFAAEAHAVVIGEGVERPAELAVLRDLGVTLVQGFHLARPSMDPADWERWDEQLPPDVRVPRPAPPG